MTDEKYGDLTWDDLWDPNEYCVACGAEIMNYHYSCQGHQNCTPECPYCGGDLREIDYRPEPEDCLPPRTTAPVLGEATRLSEASDEERDVYLQQNQP
jgi:hypothetical protein